MLNEEARLMAGLGFFSDLSVSVLSMGRVRRFALTGLEGGEERADEDELNEETGNDGWHGLAEDGEVFAGGFDVGGKDAAEHEDGRGCR